jgi:HlyD family secretion protein
MPDTSATARNGRRNWKPSRKQTLWAAAAVASVLLLLSLRPDPVEVETTTIVRGALETTVNAEGVTRVRDRYLVAAPVTGRVERLTLREGDAIDAGALLARITPMPLDAQAVAQAQARVTAARAGLSEAEARTAQARETMEQAERSAARMRSIAAEGAVSTDAVERAELEYASARRNHDAALSRAQAMVAEIAAARASLLGTQSGGDAVAIIRSPTGGRVLRVHEPSERVLAAGTPLVEIGDADGLEVVVDVLSTDAVRIEPGAPMRIVEWGGDGALDARVRIVEPSAFTKISTLGVEEQRVNVIGDLLARPASLGDGYRVQAQIVTWEATDVLRVPNSALFRTGDGWSVFVMEHGRARLQAVAAGRRGAQQTEVTGGLEAGDHVVLFPSDRVAEGVRLRPRS